MFPRNPHIGEGVLDPNEPVELIGFDLGLGDESKVVEIWVFGEQLTPICQWQELEIPVDCVFAGPALISEDTHRAVAEMVARGVRQTHQLDWYNRLLSGDSE